MLEKTEVVVRGFNGECARTKVIGKNSDGKDELFVEDMPKDLVLLSARQYAADGAIVLFAEDGYVLRIGQDEIKRMKELIKEFHMAKVLAVRENTYQVVEPEQITVEALVANTYFNTKVNVSNGEERILAYMLMGLSWEMLWNAVDKGNISGIHPGITKTLLSRFSRKWGKTPDVLQMAHPSVTGNEKGYMAAREQVVAIGEIQMDFLVWDFNEEGVDKEEESFRPNRRKKLKTFGGAVAALIVVDVKSRYTYGKLIKSVAKPVEVVKEVCGFYRTWGHTVRSLAADAGVAGSSEFRVFTTEVDQYLMESGVKIVKSDPHNHSNGTPVVERMIQSVKLRMRMAYQYAFSNKNLERIGFTRVMLKRLWGEIFHWATEVENLREVDEEMTRKQAFRGTVPNIQETRMLPIFSVVKVYRVKSAMNQDSNQPFYMYGLYVSPCFHGKGVIRVACIVSQRVMIFRTSKYKGVSDGGDAVNFLHMERGINRIIEDANRIEECDSEGNEDDVVFEEVEMDVNVRNGDHHGAGSKEPSGDLLENVNTEVTERVPAGDSEGQIGFPDKSRDHSYGTRSRRNRIIDSGFVDWRGKDKGFYFDGESREYVVLEENCVNACVAVKEGVPKSFKQALCDPVWGEPARNEFFTLTNVMRTLIPVTVEDMKKGVKDGADKVIMFPVYESKVKDGQIVKKVRLVCNGGGQANPGQTYSPTPTRTEFLILLQIVAIMKWLLVHLDESRAFLSSTYKGENPVYASVRGVSGWFRVLGALYGLRTSPRDYHLEVVERLVQMGFRRLEKCQCMFRKGKTLILDFVDDFIICGPDENEIKETITEYRKRATTTEPVWNPVELLGHTVMRDHEKGIIVVSVKRKILELVDGFDEGRIKKRRIPMRKSHYVVQESDLEQLGSDSVMLTDLERREYQKRVGSLVWISGIRFDIAFVVNYLTGYGQSPRVHHERIVEWVVGYLLNTVEMGLTLGGDKISMGLFTDSSYGTGRNGKSVSGVIVKLNENHGAVVVKSVTSQYVRLSSFESELEAISVGMKIMLWVKMVVQSVTDVDEANLRVYADNMSMMEFVKGNYELKASKHIEIKMHFVREVYERGGVEVIFVPGEDMLADGLTKVIEKSGIGVLRRGVQGCELEEKECKEEQGMVNEGGSESRTGETEELDSDDNLSLASLKLGGV